MPVFEQQSVPLERAARGGTESQSCGYILHRHFAFQKGSAVIVGTDCFTTCHPSVSRQRAAQTPACLQLTALLKYRQVASALHVASY